MPSRRECLCCRDIQAIMSKINEVNDTQVKCITEHPGFSAVCLNVWVLQTAYAQYRQQYGNYNASMHERHRYTAYRQLVRWCWGWLGREVRVILPSCAVSIIRTFPSSAYTGYSNP
uniref:P2X purinoreceptor 7 intracellular domain-containing protein n=1 Tax=Amphimedon queenslandica TaxID=400682 RepID=A0A1X7T1Y1_AMPQE